MEGRTINGFELKRLLGIGGMAEVWYAENSIHKAAAVKILNVDLAHNELIVERFRNEAEIMVKLNHPNIRQVYGYDSIDSRPSIIMEYLDGADLKERMSHGQHFSNDELKKWWNQLVDALNYTHSQGIVHRDIKPGNIFVDNQGNIKLLDFGIAKVRESISSTQTGQKLGTLMYMSPEQVRDSKHIDYRTDIYSLAVTFVHLLTGKKPYDSNTTSDFEISEKIVYSPLDLSEVPLEWRPLLASYLGKDPQQRAELQPFGVTTTRNVDIEEDDATLLGEENQLPSKSVVDQPQTGKASAKENQAKTLPVTDITAKPKSKRGLWIGIGAAVAVVAAVLITLLLLKKEEPTRYERTWNDDDKETYSTRSYEEEPVYEDANVVEAAESMAPNGAIDGLFSVSPNTQVYFSQGNLQYQASTGTWRFAGDQWETLGYSNVSVSDYYSGYIDLFGWGTGGDPTKSSTNDADYSNFYDWGNLYGGDWRTLTINEWDYLFNSRNGASSKYAAATVCNVKGIIILPDNFITPSGCNSLTIGYADYSMNNYSYNEWDQMQAAGAVFLPTAGRRTGLQIYNYGNDGDYWSSTAYNNTKAYNVDFTNGKLLAKDSSPRKHGFAVRLVKESY